MIMSLFLAAQLTFAYEKPDTTPVVFAADVRSEEAKAVDFCLWLDVIYEDGSATWGTGLARKECRPGTHGWERTVGVFRPKKPVKRIDFSTLFRGPKTSGKAEYRNATLERREPKAGEPTPDPKPSAYPYEGPARSVKGLADTASAVWTADSTERVTPRTYPKKGSPRGISLELAGRERESAQICVTGTVFRSDGGIRLIGTDIDRPTLNADIPGDVRRIVRHPVLIRALVVAAGRRGNREVIGVDRGELRIVREELLDSSRFVACSVHLGKVDEHKGFHAKS